MRYREFLLEYSREKTLANDGLMTKVMAAVARKDPRTRQATMEPDNDETRPYILDKFERIDPTPNKQYMQPIMNWYVKDKFRGFEDSDRLKNALTLFARFKQRLDKRDINQYASLHELEDAVEPHAQELTKKENEIIKDEMKTLQGQLQNQYVRTKELIDEKQEPILGNTKETKT